MKKPIERLDGMGEVYDGEELMGQFPYGIIVYQDMLGPDHSIPGLKSIGGRIDMDFNTIMQLMIGDPKLRLRLEDGRQMEFFFARNDGTIAAKGALQ